MVQGADQDDRRRSRGGRGLTEEPDIPDDGDQHARLDRLAILARRSWVVSELPGGLTNTNLRIRTTDDGQHLDLVARISREGAELLGIDRDAEHHDTAAAARAGVGAPVREYRPDLGILVIDFVDGRTLRDADFADPALLRRAATAVRRLHAGPRFARDFDMFTRRAGYLATIRERGFGLPAGYESYGPQWAEVEGALRATAPPTVPCHNDLLAANFLDDGLRVHLIDYEYAGNNDSCFELGNTATECNFDPETVDAYAEACFGDPTPAMLARIRLQALCSEYGWALWGFIQAAISPLDFDFWGWGMERFDKARARFGDPGFTRLLEEVVS